MNPRPPRTHAHAHLEDLGSRLDAIVAHRSKPALSLVQPAVLHLHP
jgi:hypothetical protein